MAYYPNNFYQNYQYGNYPQMNQTPPLGNLQGKVVDGVEVVKATDVPFGSFSVFPKGDFGEVYIKTWNNNGTTQVITYKPVVEELKKEEPNVLLEKINNIETKISNLLDNLSSSQPKPAAAAENTVKKEVNKNVSKF